MSSSISFAQNLQSDSGQAAIMFRLESELHVLEILKKFLTSQARLEKEYTNSMENATSGALKALKSVTSEGSNTSDEGATKNSNPGHGSKETVISRETMSVLEEFESTTRNLKRNLDFLEINALKELNELISQKKILIKSAKDEYNNIKGSLDKFTELIKKQKTEYFKNYKAYESARTNFENNCASGAPTNSKKSEEFREKFFRMKGRLNASHSEYLLLIHEAKACDRDFRTILLPGLLQIEQNWSEKQLSQWRRIHNDILDNASGISQTARFRLKDFEFGKEFTELITKHKSSPLAPMEFKFQPARITSQPVTQSTLIFDSSTAEFFRRKLRDFEKRLKAAELQLQDKNSAKNKYKGDELVEDLKSFDISVTQCDIDRLKNLKSYLEAHLNGLKTGNLDTISLMSEYSMKKSKGSRFATFLRNAATLKKKSVSFDESTESPVNGAMNNGRNTGNTNSFDAVAQEMAKSISEESWFHGVLPREDVVRLLKCEGDYLIRETAKNGEKQLVLSVLSNGYKHFMVQRTTDGQFRFEGPIFSTIKDLLEHYVTAKVPITNRSGAVIQTPVIREKWELNNDDVQLIEKIGKGNFGDVYKAAINGSLVAVKTCKVDLPEDQKRKFLREGRILKQYSHPNIVSFIGICAQKQPIMLVMELVPGGSLLTYLKASGQLPTNQLIQMCLDAADGMKYLEERNCLHRDLAARNCLIDENTKCVKISDFGMSREENEYTVSDGMKQIPIKWTAPEALNYGKYTALSDVWSYGILVWEIFSEGATPYPGMTNSRAREMIEAGYRMPAPERIPDVIYQLMTRCWQYEPEQRPRFSEIHSELEIIKNSDLI